MSTWTNPRKNQSNTRPSRIGPTPTVSSQQRNDPNGSAIDTKSVGPQPMRCPTWTRQFSTDVGRTARTLGGQGRDRTADLPLFRRSSGLHQCVSAGQTRRVTGIRTCWISRSGSLAPCWPHEIAQSAWQADRVTWSVEADLGEVLVRGFRLPNSARRSGRISWRRQLNYQPQLTVWMQCSLLACGPMGTTARIPI
jgi:hypothetical protein